MNARESTVQMQDLASVGSRVSWPAILAGAAVALGIYFLLGTLGTAAGLSIGDRTSNESLKFGAIAWTFIVMAVAMFVGGVVTSSLTAGENKMESIIYGIIMWAVLTTLIIVFAAVGAGMGVGALAAVNDKGSWESSARNAGVSAESIDEWKSSRTTAEREADAKAARERASKGAWYAFFGTWMAMFFAALGGWVGSGPTFRLLTVEPRPIIV